MAESYTISFFRRFALSFELSGSEVGIYKLKDFKKERKHAVDQEKNKIQEKRKKSCQEKIRKQYVDKENKKEKRQVLRSSSFFFYKFPPQIRVS